MSRMILFLGLTTVGAMHDYTLLKEELNWFDGQDAWFQCVELFVDLGYLGINNDFLIEKLRIPIKKPRKSKETLDTSLTQAQKDQNKAVSQLRVRIEHAIGAIKVFNIIAHIYRSHKKGFEDVSIGICAAIHNLRLKSIC